MIPETSREKDPTITAEIDDKDITELSKDSPATPSSSAHVSVEHLENGHADQHQEQEAKRSSDDSSVGAWEDAEEGSDSEEDVLVFEDDPAEMSSWSGQPDIKGSSEIARMVLLNAVSVGMTFTWGVEMTCKFRYAYCPWVVTLADQLFSPDCTPYLLSLGLTKGQTSMVWIAGPLSGLVVQPIIGVVSDEYRSKWGRRRPFIVIGSLLVAGGLLTLGFTKEIVGLFVSDEGARKILTIVVAVFALYATDFAINAGMYQ